MTNRWYYLLYRSTHFCFVVVPDTDVDLAKHNDETERTEDEQQEEEDPYCASVVLSSKYDYKAVCDCRLPRHVLGLNVPCPEQSSRLVPGNDAFNCSQKERGEVKTNVDKEQKKLQKSNKEEDLSWANIATVVRIGLPASLIL
ncbi:hypothetical protein F2P81_001670 [Scophthalmus maximus]|uniref:Uncharacterized protein n=1 Tax=Scophthalmus maximus TaxID=52904 RepID=A0A6A4TQV0_SCOMX|nr:hypothetical protein F2P81_001670 [Scophthalmus maximus]